jgi:carbon starvation protein
MLLEGFVALIALATIMIVAKGDTAGKAPGAIYGQGLGRFLTVVIGEKHLTFAITFGAMAFSTFVFDTLDVTTRLGRYILQELLGWRGKAGAFVATGVVCLFPLTVLLVSEVGSYRLFWTLFGTSNQLLAGLSLLAVSVWLHRSGRRYYYTLVPAIFVLGITLSALFLQMRDAVAGTVGWIGRWNGVAAAALIALSLVLFAATARALRAPASAPAE